MRNKAPARALRLVEKWKFLRAIDGVTHLASRANWKGFLTIGDMTCPVALYSAASTSERIALHTINRASGHRVHRQFVDAETEKPVRNEDLVKGYETAKGDYIMFEPDEISAAVPQSDKTLAVSAFVGCAAIDEVYFDKPYYLAPAGKIAQESFGLIREGLRKKKVAAIARAVLFRRVRTLLVRVHGKGLIATTLNFDNEVRAAKDAFRDVPEKHIKGEGLALAKHIIQTKKGKFDIAAFDDRYEAALAELVKAKIEGKTIKPRKPVKQDNVIDLMTALRRSAGAKPRKAQPHRAIKAKPVRRKAG